MARPDPTIDEEEERLVRAARRGEARALEALLLRHEARVLRVLGLLGVRPADREDVAQEVLIRVFRHLDGFRAGQSFGGWVYRITVNAAHDHRAHLARRKRTEAEWSSEMDSHADEGPGPAEHAAGRDRARQLEAALETLSDRERAVFVLCELEGLDTRQVGRTLGISSITVRRHLGRARSRLQEALQAAPPGPTKKSSRD